jgi:hypothetical protein
MSRRTSPPRHLRNPAGVLRRQCPNESAFPRASRSPRLACQAYERRLSLRPSYRRVFCLPSQQSPGLAQILLHISNAPRFSILCAAPSSKRRPLSAKAPQPANAQGRPFGIAARKPSRAVAGRRNGLLVLPVFLYMFAHDVHHRAQIIMLAHQLGYRLPDIAAYGIWQWDKLWKELGFLSWPSLNRLPHREPPIDFLPNPNRLEKIPLPPRSPCIESFGPWFRAQFNTPR